ncbi:Quinidine resistance protein 2 [Escovopsis weberi]|uniref:Quinidine resistance protein 2 n=1 Tax=Escovopsis weberi TaxID=150374 RepID=A0A0M8N4Q8_ESCWE|nr:Quinidine resistance protein 2 [Escovopsis weberi]
MTALATPPSHDAAPPTLPPPPPSSSSSSSSSSAAAAAAAESQPLGKEPPHADGSEGAVDGRDARGRQDNAADSLGEEQEPKDLEEGAVTVAVAVADGESAQPPKYSVFTTWEKRGMALAAAVTAIFSPLSAQIYLPALNVISKDLGLSNAKVNLTITTYMILQGVTPMFIGSLADSGGRRPAYLICFVIYIAANIGLALAPGYGAILGLRCLQSAGSSSTVALCVAVISDIVTSAERGQYVGFTSMPSVLGPALGPIIGGLLSQYLGWRSIFWFLAIFAGVTIVLIACFMPETCRHVVGDGSLTPPVAYRSLWQVLTHRRLREVGGASPDVPRPPKSGFTFKPPNILGSLMLLLQKETGLLLGSSGFVFAGFYAVVAAMPTLYQRRYGYNDIEVGLMYLPLSFGSVVAASVAGFFINRNYRRHHDRLGLTFDSSRQQDLSRFPIERARLEVGLPLLLLAGAAMAAWGWAMHASVHAAVLCVVSVFIGIGIIGFNNTSAALLVDIHPGKAGTATAANNLTRCLIGAGASAAIIPMIDAMGIGWAFTLVGGILVLCAAPMLLIMAKGMEWRAERRSYEERKSREA